MGRRRFVPWRSINHLRWWKNLWEIERLERISIEVEVEKFTRMEEVQWSSIFLFHIYKGIFRINITTSIFLHSGRVFVLRRLGMWQLPIKSYQMKSLMVKYETVWNQVSVVTISNWPKKKIEMISICALPLVNE